MSDECISINNLQSFQTPLDHTTDYCPHKVVHSLDSYRPEPPGQTLFHCHRQNCICCTYNTMIINDDKMSLAKAYSLHLSILLPSVSVMGKQM